MARTRSRKRRPAGPRPARQAGEVKVARQGGDAKEVRQGGDAKEAQQGGDANEARQGGDAKEVRQAGDAKHPRQQNSAKRARQASDAKRARRAASTSSKARRKPHSSPAAPTYGERPHSPWHPLPLSELLILVGAVFVILGVRKLDAHHPDISNGGPSLLAGLGAVAIGSFEVALREHRSGYRSHTIMLALLVVLIFHSLVLLGVSLFATVPRLLNVGLFAVDIALFAFLFRQLRVRFLDARHARVLKEG